MTTHSNDDLALTIEPSTSNSARTTITIAVLILFLLIIYWPSFAGQWYLDDFGNIHENPNVHLTTLTADEIQKSFYGRHTVYTTFDRPLAYLSLALNYYWSGLEPRGYHAVNFCIHAATTVLLFLLLLKMLQLPVLKGRYSENAYAIALLATLFWATHPIQVNAVTYIVQRMAALAGLFTVAALYCYLMARMTTFRAGNNRLAGSAWYAAAGIAGVCAVASKQNAAMLPISLLLCERLLIQEAAFCKNLKLFLKVLLPPTIVFIFLSVYLGSLTAFQSGFNSRPFSMVERVLTEPRVIIFYLGQLFYPTGSTFTLLHDIQISTSLFSPWTTLPAILLLTFSVLGFLYVSRKRPLLTFCYLFFLLNHVIEGSIIPLELIFEHRNYLPSLFLFVLPAVVFCRAIAYFNYAPRIQILAAVGAIVLLTAQAHSTYQQNVLFSHPVAFWQANVRAYPNLHRPRHNLARALLVYGLADDAEKQMFQSLDGKNGARVHQKYITHYNLGVYYFHKRQYQQALDQFAIILTAAPRHLQTLQKTAELFLEAGDSEQALQVIQKALVHAPKEASLYVLKGFALLSTGNVDGALLAADRAEAMGHPALAIDYIRGESHRLEGNLKRAREYFEKISGSGREHFPAVIALIELYHLAGEHSRLQQAILDLQKIAADRETQELLAAYDRRWNFVGADRMQNLARALK